jgi:hypothetical protein
MVKSLINPKFSVIMNRNDLEYYLLGHSAVQSIYEPKFLRNILPPSSGPKIGSQKNYSASSC